MSKKEVKALKDELKALQQSSDEELKELKLEVKRLSKVNEKQRLEVTDPACAHSRVYVSLC